MSPIGKPFGNVGEARDVQTDPQKQRSGRRRPERIDAGVLLVEHVRDALQTVDAQRWVVRDVAERIPARGVAGFGKRIEEEHGMALARAMTSGDHVVFALRVDADQRVRPLEEIRDDDACALTAARTRDDGDALLARQA